MVRISKIKEDKIMSNIVGILFQHAPKSLFTSEISKLEARDEEFVKRLLQQLNKKGLIILINKNKDGKVFLKRQRWRLSNEAYEIYKQRQTFSGFQIAEAAEKADAKDEQTN